MSSSPQYMGIHTKYGVCVGDSISFLNVLCDFFLTSLNLLADDPGRGCRRKTSAFLVVTANTCLMPQEKMPIIELMLTLNSSSKNSVGR